MNSVKIMQVWCMKLKNNLSF